jgi:hypothetical protein
MNRADRSLTTRQATVACWLCLAVGLAVGIFAHSGVLQAAGFAFVVIAYLVWYRFVRRRR